MAKEAAPRVRLGGKSAFNWKFLAYSLPLIIFEVPFTSNNEGDWWTFWRWTAVSLAATTVIIFMYALGDFYFFHDRELRPIPDWLTYSYGFLTGALFGGALGALTYLAKLKNENLIQQILESGLSSGLTGALLLPLSSLVSYSVSVYKSDREALIAERMLIESQKAESKAVVESLRSSMSNKVDENLLEIIENSKEFFNSKSRSLEQNWELLAGRLRSAALETIRPFSHKLHRRGSEIDYRVQIMELASYIAYKSRVHVFLSVFIYFTLTYHTYFIYSDLSQGFKKLGIRIATLISILAIVKFLRSRNFFRGPYSFIGILTIASLIFSYLTQRINHSFGLKAENFSTYLYDSAVLLIVVLTVSLGMAFLYGGHAEIEFLERRISEEQLETMLLRREEARISRELAKYLHGTIQSRLMASAIGVESAGRRGDKKALQREVKQAYKNLKVPSASYFSNPETTINEEIKKVVAKWKDLMDIKTSIAKTIPALPDNLVQDIGNAVNEALSNAFRHGSAQKVSIKISYKAKYLEIEVVDDGVGPTKGKGGLGAEWFDALAGKNWSLNPNPKGGSILYLLVPVNS